MKIRGLLFFVCHEVKDWFGGYVFGNLFRRKKGVLRSVERIIPEVMRKVTNIQVLLLLI